MNSYRIAVMDIGNTNTDIALFENSQILLHEFLPSSAEYGDKICRIIETRHLEKSFDHILIASVVPAVGDLLVTLLMERLGLKSSMVEDFKTQLLPLRVDRPETVGVDRVVNSYAAVCLFGGPAIVVSLGTATTFEVISSQGEYLGGAIYPGIKISLEALTQRTALLPPVVWSQPKHLIAKNTLEHIQSGIFYGTVSLIEGMVKRIRTALGEPAKVIGTGGLSHSLADQGIFDHHEPLLTLKGLDWIYRNRVGTTAT